MSSKNLENISNFENWGLTLVANKKNKCGNFKDTHWEKVPLNKTQAITKSMNMDIWVVATSNLLFKRGSYNEIKFSKK